MRYFVLIATLFFVGCNKPNKFEVGDCIAIANDECEVWENCRQFVHKVLQVGKAKYRTIAVDTTEKYPYVYNSDSRFHYDDFMEKVNCPAYLDEKFVLPTEKDK
jgi:hypothetical protein